MKSRLPQINKKKKVCIICEGFEEFEYVNKLLELDVWNDAYDFVPKNADSCTKIAAVYSLEYMSDSYDIVLVYCDTDGTPYESYKEIKDKIGDIHGSADSVLIFANPCTMQIILMHLDKVLLCSHKKEDNKTIIKNLTTIGSYQAKKKQRDRLFALITKENYVVMKRNIAELSSEYIEINSTNFDKFIKYFEGESDAWIKRIYKDIGSD